MNPSDLQQFFDFSLLTNKMKYIELLTVLKRNNLSIFSLQDIQNLFRDEKLKTLKNNLKAQLKLRLKINAASEKAIRSIKQE